MRYLLSRQSRPVLKRLAQERTLCAFDFDGTLAPIVEHPANAGMSAETRGLLARLAANYPCVILSGRARSDLLKKMRGTAVIRMFGSHGADSPDSKAKAWPQVERWRLALERQLKAVHGLWIEDKGRSLAVHYRQSANKDGIRQQILEAAQDLRGARVVGGKQVVNVVMKGDPDKGTVLRAERDRMRCTWVLYVGDDENDESAFAIGGQTISVRIGKKRLSNARYYLRSQSEIDGLLEALVGLREGVRS